MTIWTRNKVQGTRHKIQELLTTHSNLPVTINPKFEFRNPNLQHPASNLKPQTSNLKPQTSNFKHHSVRKDFTGLATAAFIACALIVINAIRIAIAAARTKTHHPILTR